MRKVVAIALNTFREAIRDRIFHSLIAFAVVMFLSSLVLSRVTVGDRLRLVMDLGLASIHLFGVLVAIAVGTGLVYKEIAKRTVFTLLSKPLTRPQFILGKYLGLISVLAVHVTLMTIVFHVLYLGLGGRMTVVTVQAVLLVAVELMVVTGVVIVFSSFTSPFTSGLLSLLFFVAGHMVDELGKYVEAERYAGHPALGIWKVAFATLPDLEKFNLKEHALYGLQVAWGDVALSALYGLGLCVFFVTLACALFSRREFH